MRAFDPPTFTAISAGWDHACAVTLEDEVECWGHNDAGQLGNGTTVDSYTPVQVVGLSGPVVAVEAGLSHTCVLTADGGVQCWGGNAFGQLGDGSTEPSLYPVDVEGLPDGVSAIAAGDQYTCALRTTGGVVCWGRNENHQLGDGTYTDRSTPVDVIGLGAGVSAIAAGGFKACALKNTGGVACWGSNVGGGPADVPGLSSGVSSIAVGHQHACAVTNVGGAVCWGLNINGELGDGTTIASETPVQVTGLSSGVAAIAAGYLHSCAVTTDGGVKCWGRGFEGQLGDGTATQRGTPVDALGLESGVFAVSTGSHYSCALTLFGAVACWGRNDNGQLGDGTQVGRDAPVDMAFVINQTVILRTSRPAGPVRLGQTVKFTATARPVRPTGSHSTVRFVVWRLVNGAWRLTAQRDVVADPSDNNRARLSWTFTSAGWWYVRARVISDGAYLTSPWSPLVRYRVT